MKIKDLSLEEIEEKSYAELTEIVLNQKGSKMKIVDIFKTICDAKGLSEKDFENKVADFFELISTDKNFVVLEKGYCDLRIKHNQKVMVEEDDDEVIDTEVEEDVEEVEETEEDENEDIFYDSSSDDDDVNDDDDDLADFIVVDEDEASM